MLSKLTNLFTRGRFKDEQLENLHNLLSLIVADGVISPQEVEQIREFMAQSGLEPADAGRVRDTVFNQVLSNYVADRRVTSEERVSLLHIGQTLGVSNQALGQAQSQLDFFGLLQSLEALPFDSLPHNNGTSGILLQAGERDYFAHSANLLEERVVRSRISGNSAGVGFRVMKGVSFRVGQSRGHVVSDREMVPVSCGVFVITNERLIFSGDRKSINAPISKLLDLEIFSDGLRFSLTNRQKAINIQFFTPASAEIAGVLLSRIFNR